MKYISTRGDIKPINFKDAVMMGLATDGGLLLPKDIPLIKSDVVAGWSEMSYQQLAFEVISLFATDIPQTDLKILIDKSYATFSHSDVTPVVKHDGLYILELFHGPTLAFKDVALQLLGNLFEYMLAESGAQMNILGATSGDTGSAAIHGVRGKDRINIFILHPHKKVSPIQELQMTSVLDRNVYNIAIKGTFDDGQAIVKSIFNDIPFKQQFHLGAINSINWARIMAQIVYYIYSYFKVSAKEGTEAVDFAVPTGNFGDILAGYIARRMLSSKRIRRLVLATNDNDILSRFVLNGDYSTGQVLSTCSPSMDIQLASNFERYLYYLHGQDSAKTRADMEEFAASGALSFNQDMIAKIRQDFSALKVSEKEVISTISSFYNKTNYVLDPHTAVAVNAGMNLREDVPMVCLATAHPGKFGETVGRAIGDQPLPESLADLLGKPTRCEVMNAEAGAVTDFIRGNA